jgi:hypothetical protein
MINIERDSFGAIDYTLLRKNSKYSFISNVDNNTILINYDNIYYYLKKCRNLDYLYNELVAQELALDYNIDCTEYDLFVDEENYGTISKRIYDNNSSFIIMQDLIDNTNYTTSLDDLWLLFNNKYGYINATTIMNQLINMFIFDIIIGNSDRHSLNYGIIYSNVSAFLAPLFDNEMLFSDYALDDKYFSIFVNRSDSKKKIGTFNSLKKIMEYDSKYFNKLRDNIYLVSENNMLKVFSRVENKIGTEMHPVIKEKLLRKSKDYYTMLRNELEM